MKWKTLWKNSKWKLAINIEKKDYYGNNIYALINHRQNQIWRIYPEDWNSRDFMQMLGILKRHAGLNRGGDHTS